MSQKCFSSNTCCFRGYHDVAGYLRNCFKNTLSISNLNFEANLKIQSNLRLCNCFLSKITFLAIFSLFSLPKIAQNREKMRKFDFYQSHDQAFWRKFLWTKWSFLSKKYILKQILPKNCLLKDPLGFGSRDAQNTRIMALDRVYQWAFSSNKCCFPGYHNVAGYHKNCLEYIFPPSGFKFEAIFTAQSIFRLCNFSPIFWYF